MNETNRFTRGARQGLRLAIAAGVLAVFCSRIVSGADAGPAVDPPAAEWLKRMGDCLAKTPSFSVNAEVWQDVQLASGQRLQAGRNIELQVRRPDRFHAEVRSTRRDRGLFYDGRTMTLLDRAHKFYGSISASGTLDEALDLGCERFGITMPLEDLVVSDPYQSAMQHIVSGSDVGPVTVLGTPCEHLAFSLGAVDWQVWIEQGANPVPRKIVITYKDEEGSPQYTAILSDWNLDARLPDSVFAFAPPAGVSRIKVAEIKARNGVRKEEGKSP
jgi:hypothetical protein